MPELTRAAQELRAVGERIHDDLVRLIRRKTIPIWLTIAAVIVTGAVAVAWNRWDITRSERQWCGVLVILTDPEPTPETVRGRDSLRELTRLRQTFDCELPAPSR